MAIHVLANQLAAAGGGYEPQRQHNWSLLVHDIIGNDDVLSLSLVTGFLPRVSNEELEIPYGNERVWAAGKAVWDQGTVVVRDWIDRPTAKIVYDWRQQVYDPLTGQIGLCREYKKQCDVFLFAPNSTDGGGSGARIWVLHGAWPVSVAFAANGLDQTSSGQVQIEMVMRYDKAEAEVIDATPL